MSTSRRKFLKAGMLAAVFAAGPIKIVTGHTWKDREGNPDDPQLAPDTLGNYSKATFSSYLNSVFQIHTVSGIVEATLTEVHDMPSSNGGESFSLLFRGGRQPLRQDTYQIDHAALGTFPLLLVPAAADANGAQGFVATFNRLSYAEVLQNPAPRRNVRAERALESRPSSGSKPAPATFHEAGQSVPKKKSSRKEPDNDLSRILN